MLQCKKVEQKNIVGMELFTLEEAKDKSKKEGFLLMNQSNVTEEAYGILKPFRSHKEEGFYFIPVFIKGQIITI